MKNIIVSGSGLVLVVLTAALGATACGDSGSGDTGGGGGAGGSSASSDSSSSSSTSSDSPSSSSSTGSPASSSNSSSSGSGGMVAPGLIDDMEDKDGAIITAEGRQGYWYTYSDGTGTMTVPGKTFTMDGITPPRDTSKFAAHMAGMGFTMYGGGMGFDLNAMGTTKSGYDGSGYSGVTFFARIGKGTSAALRVNISDKDTAPEGKVCDNAKNKCNDFHGKDLTLTEDWKQYTLKFSELKQQGYGDPFPKLLTTALYGMSFAVGTKVTFDVWIDDLTFVK